MIKEFHQPSIAEKTGGSSRIEDSGITSQEKNFLERKREELGNVTFEKARKLLKERRS